MKKNKLLVMLACLGLLVTGCNGCGSKASTESTKAPTSSKQPSTQTTQSQPVLENPRNYRCLPIVRRPCPLTFAIDSEENFLSHERVIAAHHVRRGHIAGGGVLVAGDRAHVAAVQGMGHGVLALLPILKLLIIGIIHLETVMTESSI